jgi:hypothetical protein
MGWDQTWELSNMTSHLLKQCVYKITAGNGQYPTYWKYWYNVKDLIQVKSSQVLDHLKEMENE